MLDTRPTLFVAVVLALLLATFFVHAEQHKVTLKGTLFVAEGECHFFLDPAGDSESVGLDASSGAYLCDYLQGGNAKPFTVILIPE